MSGHLVAPPQPVGPPASNAVRMIRLLAVISLLCGLLIVFTHLNTLTRIRHNQEIILRESVAQLLPGIEKQVIYGMPPSGELTIIESVEATGPRFFAGYDASGKFLGVVIEASERGYSDFISAMYAYSPETETVTGFQVVESKETPGLGDRIGSDPGFRENFKSLDAKLDGDRKREAHPIAAVKHGTKKNAWEIDAISGATVSSRAVGRMLERSVREVAPLVLKNLDRIKRGN